MRKIFILSIFAICLWMSNPAKALEEVTSTSLTGYVDSSLYVDLNEHAGDGEQIASFGLDMVEFNVTKEVKDHASVRADIEFTENAINLEQGYVSLTLPFSKALSFKFGKFNAPIGFEGVDAPDLFQFSHALVYDYGIPADIVGVDVSYALTDEVSLQGYVINGWNEGITADNNNFKSKRPSLTKGRNLCPRSCKPKIRSF